MYLKEIFGRCYSSAHRWLKGWQSDGTFVQLQSRVLGIADNKGLINWNYGAVDGSLRGMERVEVKMLLMVRTRKRNINS